jgi:biopolymer transport protein TolR
VTDRTSRYRLAVPTTRSEINVTPLIDVCLVLLLIFMIVTPLLTEGASVELPETANPAQIPRPDRQVTLVLDASGTLSIGEERWFPGALAEPAQRARFERALEGRSAREVVLRADGRLPYRKVREVLGAASTAHLEGMALAAVRRHHVDEAPRGH